MELLNFHHLSLVLILGTVLLHEPCTMTIRVNNHPPSIIKKKKNDWFKMDSKEANQNLYNSLSNTNSNIEKLHFDGN